MSALFCSQRCPENLVLKMYDLARSMHDTGVPVIGGFPRMLTEPRDIVLGPLTGSCVTG